MSNLKKDALSHPIYHAAIIFLLAMAAFLLPVGRVLLFFVGGGVRIERVATILVRLVIIALSLIFIIKYDLIKCLKSFSAKGFLLSLPAFLVAINNAPLFSIFLGSAKINASAVDIVIYAAYCLSIGVSEELVFFGLIFPLVKIVFENKKNALILSVIVSSLIFSLSHAVNLLSGAGVLETLLQLLYTFLIGATFLIVLIYTKNLLVAGLLHGIYDFGGLMLERVGIGSGKYFTTQGVILTVILGVLVGAYMLFLIIKENKRHQTLKTKND